MRVLLVDDNAERAKAVQTSLEAEGCVVVGIAPGASDLVSEVRRTIAEVIVYGLDSPSRDALESLRALQRDEPRPVAMFVDRSDPASLVAAVDAGIAAYVVGGLAPNRVKSVLDVAMAQFRVHQILRAERDTARDALDLRTRIERAKRILIQRRGMTEDAAHRSLRRLAMDQGKRLADIANEIISTEESLNIEQKKPIK